MKRFRTFRAYEQHSKKQILPTTRHERDNLRRWREHGLCTFNERTVDNAIGVRNRVVVLNYKLTKKGKAALA